MELPVPAPTFAEANNALSLSIALIALAGIVTFKSKNELSIVVIHAFGNREYGIAGING
jgi:hypothetical protein